jgi:hypothetical protein
VLGLNVLVENLTILQSGVASNRTIRVANSGNDIALAGNMRGAIRVHWRSRRIDVMDNNRVGGSGRIDVMNNDMLNSAMTILGCTTSNPNK